MIIQAKNLSFKYPINDNYALDQVNFEIEKGECIVLCGKSGCGKTTLTRILNGLAPEYIHGELEGTCKILDLEAGKDPIEKYVSHIGSVFQNPKTQYFNTNTTAELVFPCENMGVPRDEIEQKLKHCIEEYNISSFMDRSIFHLSGGEKQKVSFAASSILDPEILILDEPTSNLDLGTIDEIKEMILNAKKEGKTIILAEHRLAWTKEFADRYFYFNDGKLEKIYTKDEFLSLKDEELQEKGIRSIDLEPYHRSLKEKENKPSMHAYLTTSNLEIGYEKEAVVKKIEHLELGKGEAVAIMGHNGVGKSTLIRTLCGLLKPIHGDIYLDEKKATKNDLIKKSFLVMQDVNYQLFSDSVKEEVLLNTGKEDCNEILESLNLLDLAERHPMSLSGGQKQRVAIASSIASEKEIIFFDEPTSGLDRYHMEKVSNTLNMLKSMNKVIVVITHDEEFAAMTCDRIVRLV